MSTIDRNTIVTNYLREMDEGAAALFIGAGMSLSSGYVNWKDLMRGIANEVQLDVDKERDLIAIAQYHVNTRRTRSRINQQLVSEFCRKAQPSENHRLIAQLPISSIWTTNYDKLLEDSYSTVYKTADVKRRPQDLAITKPKSDVIIYKMHGDVDSPDEAVLTKDDYANYEENRGLFSTQLRGHLVSRSFLFLGYSFSDPNIDYILARIRVALGGNKREHFCIMRNIEQNNELNSAEYDYKKRLLELRIDDLQNYGIQTHLVDDYSEITEILRDLQRHSRRKKVFISGSAHEFEPIGRESIDSLAVSLGKRLIKEGFDLVSGIGLGIGGTVLIGALEELYRKPPNTIGDRLTLRPFPQSAPQGTDLPTVWATYRNDMLSDVGFAIFISGNKLDGSGKTVLADGVMKEFEIAVGHHVYPIPIGATGHAALKIHKIVTENIDNYYGEGIKQKILEQLSILGDTQANVGKWISAILVILKITAPE